jgi:hypothetical protein
MSTDYQKPSPRDPTRSGSFASEEKPLGARSRRPGSTGNPSFGDSGISTFNEGGSSTKEMPSGGVYGSTTSAGDGGSYQAPQGTAELAEKAKETARVTAKAVS